MAPCIWSTGGAKSMAFIAEVVDDDVCLSRGDRVGAIAPAALRARTCRRCGFVRVDASISDFQICSTCGALVPKGPSPWRERDAGPEFMKAQLRACRSDCKGAGFIRRERARRLERKRASGLAPTGLLYQMV